MTFKKTTVPPGAYKFKQLAWGDITVPVTVIQSKDGLEVVFAKGHKGILLQHISDTAIFENES